MKYKVGDKVKIKSLEWYRKNKNLSGEIGCFCQNFVKSMSMYCGNLATITSVSPYRYTLDIDEGYWSWDDLMLEDDSLSESDSNGAELKDTIEVIKEKRFQAACSAMQGLCVGKTTADIKKGQCCDIAELSLLLADELLKQGGYTE